MAIGAGFKKIKLEDQATSLFQDNVDRSFNNLANHLLLNGAPLTVDVVTGDNIIKHKLGRKISGYLRGPQSASMTYYDNISTSTDLDTEFTLVATGPATLKLWVY